ncbi:hypothetical protein FALBO_11663 [Fusarium albosuccineum]|uniref:C2H2-type domain-containing protein n=1 Tax=Fusarium albosuccineum TaxID=1237068 RepID=A0A8H4PHP9_9HYPO|nr:hypothetical protein FALBO_11663 [Fusarium albosuccineum]
MSVCSVGSHGSIASNASGHYATISTRIQAATPYNFSHRTYNPPPSPIPMLPLPSMLTDHESARMMDSPPWPPIHPLPPAQPQQPSPPIRTTSPVVELSEDRVKRLQSRIRAIERRLDRHHSCDELLGLNKDKLQAKCLTADDIDKLQQQVDRNIASAKWMKKYWENRIAKGGYRLTESSLEALNKESLPSSQTPATPLDRWLRRPQPQMVLYNSLFNEDHPITSDHDYETVVAEGAAVQLSGPRSRDALKTPRRSLCDSVQPWRPDETPRTKAKSETDVNKSCARSLKHKVDDTVQGIMAAFERWLDVTLDEFYEAPNEGDAPKSSSTSDSNGGKGDAGDAYGKTTPPCSKKRRREDGTPDPDEEKNHGDARHGKRPRLDEEEPEPKKLACPYFKRQPEEYYRLHKGTACVGDGWTTFHRAREHLYRRHAMGHRCPRCYFRFQTEEDLVKHQRATAACQINHKPRDGFDLEVEGKIKGYKHKRGASEGEKWLDIYRVLFPHDDPNSIPSPYFDDELPSSLGTKTAVADKTSNVQYATYLREELPSIFRRLLQEMFQQEVSGLNERMQQRIVAAVDNAQHIAFHRFLREASENELSEHLRPRPSSETGDGSNKVVTPDDVPLEISNVEKCTPLLPLDAGSKEKTVPDGLDPLKRPFGPFWQDFPTAPQETIPIQIPNTAGLTCDMLSQDGLAWLDYQMMQYLPQQADGTTFGDTRYFETVDPRSSLSSTEAEGAGEASLMLEFDPEHTAVKDFPGDALSTLFSLPHALGF